MGSRYDLSFCAYTTACLATELLVSMCPRPHLWFWLQNSVFWDRIISLYWSQSSPVVLCRQYAVISTRITSLYLSQTPPVILCVQNRVPSIRITSLYGSQPSSVCFFSCKTATLWPDLQVGVGPRPHLWFWAHITACLAQEYKDNMGSSPHLWFCAFKQRL